MAPVVEGPLTSDDLERFYALVMDGNEPWQVIGRKLLGEFLGLVANVSDVRAAALAVTGEVDEIRGLAGRLAAEPPSRGVVTPPRFTLQHGHPQRGRVKNADLASGGLLPGSRQEEQRTENAASAPCTRCGATPETGQTVGCPECEGVVGPRQEAAEQTEATS